MRRAFETYEQGKPDEARGLLTFAQERSKQLFGADHPSTMLLQRQLASLDREIEKR